MSLNKKAFMTGIYYPETAGEQGAEAWQDAEAELAGPRKDLERLRSQ
jgi:hypothetical protein